MRRTLVADIAMAVAIAASLAPPIVMASTDINISDTRQALERAQAATADLQTFSLRTLDLQDLVLYAAERKSKGAPAKRSEGAEPVATNQRQTAFDQRSMPLLL